MAKVGRGRPRESFRSSAATDKILAGGNFTNIGGINRSYLARLDANTGLADTFAPAIDGPIDSIDVQPDGSIMITGQFSHINGQPYNGIAQLDGDTGMPDSLQCPEQRSDQLNCDAEQWEADGKRRLQQHWRSKPQLPCPT